jgi:hypothetical protein
MRALVAGPVWLPLRWQYANSAERVRPWRAHAEEGGFALMVVIRLLMWGLLLSC